MPNANQRTDEKNDGRTGKRLLNAGEAARYLGVKKTTIYCWSWQGKIPSVKMGSRLLFDRKDLDTLIEKWKRPVVTESEKK